jgi:diaminopimelate decarboxylase
LWLKGEGHLIRAHETFEDLLKNQILLPAFDAVMA